MAEPFNFTWPQGQEWSPTAALQPSTSLDKFVNAIDQIGKGYVGAVQSYYQAKGAVADAKLQARGSPYTQAANVGYGAISLPPTNLLLIGGLGLAAVLLLTNGGGRRR